jgi:hypothetical protein
MPAATGPGGGVVAEVDPKTKAGDGTAIPKVIVGMKEWEGTSPTLVVVAGAVVVVLVVAEVLIIAPFLASLPTIGLPLKGTTGCGIDPPGRK